MSSLFLRGNKVYISYKQNGRWKQATTGITAFNGKIPKVAYEIQAKIEASALLDRLDLSRKRIKISDLTEEYISSRIIERSTAELYRRYADQLVEISGCTFADEVPATVISKIVKRSIHTRLSVIRHLHALWRYARRKHYVKENIFEDVNKQSPPIKVRTFSPEDLHKLFTTCEKDYSDLSNQLKFLLFTGFRVTESCVLKWEDLNSGGAVITHRNRKKHHENLYPIDQMMTAFFDTLSHEYDPYVFKYRNRFDLYRDFKKARSASQIHHRLTMHDLKRTYVNAILKSTKDMGMAKDLSHHSAIATTMTYYKALGVVEEQRSVAENARKLLVQ